MLLELDRDGDGRADVTMALTGLTALTTANFADLSIAPLGKTKAQSSATPASTI